jgi:hypothetical protein
LNLVDGRELIGRRAEAFRRDHGRLRAAADHHSGKCDHNGRDQRYDYLLH